MGQTKIEWTERTWNPITGCTKVSTGCTNCFAETMAKRLKAMGRPEYQDAINGNGKWTGRVTLVPERLEEPLKRKKPTTYFVNSMSDLFHEDVPDEFIERVFAVMERCKQHTFQVLTKRAKRMRDFCNHPSGKRLPAYNVQLGVSVENQKTADARIPLLLQIPSMRFVSAEPLLELLRLWPWLPIHSGPMPDNDEDFPEFTDIIWRREYTRPDLEDNLHWLIVGCESGPHRRPAELDWFRSLRDQCVAAEVPFFLKQMDVGGKLEKMPELDGHIWNQMPEVA